MGKRKKKRKVKPFRLLLVCTMFLSLICLSLCVYLFFNSIRVENKKMIIGYEEIFHPEENISFVLMGNKEDVQIDNLVDTKQLGKYTCTYFYKGKTIPVHVEVKDIRSPKLQVKELTVDMTEEITAEMFVESIEDQTETSISLKKKSSHKEGDHSVTIVAEDASGNKTEKKTVLHRIKDITPPTITIDSNCVYTVGQEITSEGFARISDDRDPFPTLEIDMSQVNGAVPGMYTVTCIGKDRSGNETRLEQNITIKDVDSPDAKVVYLTFDDGPSENTAKVLDVLKQYNVQATFFVTGNNAGYRDNIVRAYQEGHSIGLYSYTHKYASIYASEDAYFQDLEQVNDMVEQLTGQRSNLMRFPGGSSNTVSASYSEGIMSKLIAEVRQKGYQYFDWNCSSSDAASSTVDTQQIIDSATSCASQYIIILFHDSDTKDTTVEALPKVIEYYRENGYIFKGLDINSYAAHHGVNN